MSNVLRVSVGVSIGQRKVSAAAVSTDNVVSFVKAVQVAGFPQATNP